MSDDDALAVEFDTVAGWTEEAVAVLGPDHAIPAACRGSGSPAALEWLALGLDVDRSSRMVDVGGGVGGPAAWLRDHRGVRPVVAEPMPSAAGAAARLFGLPVVTAWSQQLPLASGTFDAAWCLGVLDTTPDKQTLLAEVRRVLRPGGALGLLVYVRTVEEIGAAIEGNAFPTRTEVDALLTRVGFHLERSCWLDELPDAPTRWRELAAAVEQRIGQRHGGDPRWKLAEHQGQAMRQLLGTSEVRAWLVHAL